MVFRYIIDNTKNFYDNIRHRTYELLTDDKIIYVHDENDVDIAIKSQIDKIKHKKIGILLSGGMDSACLASYIPGSDAYTFRFLDGKYQSEELKRAEYYARKWKLRLHYVDINWDTVENNLNELMISKGAPVHSIEPQILQAIKQSKKDGIELMIIGDAADYVFGGMDGLYAKDWEFDEFKERYTYTKAEDVLCNPVNLNYAFEKYRIDKKIDFVNFMHEYADTESYASYENAFNAGNMAYIDPYECLKLNRELDLNRIRNGESKYIIRALFKLKYPEMDIPNKLPMPRPVDDYFKNWNGPLRPEFRTDININEFTGNQKWQMFCLEKFLNLYEPI